MAEFQKIAAVCEMPPPGEAREFMLNQRTICVANEKGKYFAMDNVCAHRGGPLGQGVVDAGKMVCPWHGWQFDLLTGKSEQNEALGVGVYELQVVGEDVLVKV